MQILGNKVSAEYKQTIKTRWKACYPLMPTNVHHRSRTEGVIQTFKDHLIAILVGIIKTYPRPLLDLLLPQAKITVNLL